MQGRRFDKARADRVVRFFERALVHTKGRYAKHPFVLSPWQRDDVVRPLFGTVRYDDQLESWIRAYTLAWLELARKNGKSEIMAGCGLYLLSADGEEGAEVYGCLDPMTKVLCGDLTWRPISSLARGDQVVSIDESPPCGGMRRLRCAEVLNSWPTTKRAVRIHFEDGRTVICSTDHRWLSNPPNGNFRSWRPAAKLAAGYCVLDVLTPWSTGLSRTHGYLAGLYDGEGSFHAPLRPGAAFRINFTQRPGSVLDAFRAAMKEIDLPIARSIDKGSGCIDEVVTGLRDTMRLLGEVRPDRLLDRHHELWDGRTPGGDARMLKITQIEDLGERQLWDIETTTGTYIAEGLASHNCAKDKDQAKPVYLVAKRMLELSPALSRMQWKGRKRFQILESQLRIVDRKTESFYQVVAADGSGNLGSNPFAVLFDEVLTQPNRELWEAFIGGFGTRDEPLMIAATTAGNDPTSMAAEEHIQSEKVARDPSIEPNRFVYMRNLPAEADWRDEKNWHFPNPALGDFLRIQVLRDEAQAAEGNLRKIAAFRQFRLNQWQRGSISWLDLDLWDANAGLVVEEALRGETCWGGLDIASTSDFTAWLLFFPGDVEDFVLARFFLPRAAVERRSRMRDQLERWEAEGFLTVTEGDVIDHEVIFEQIDRDAQDFRIQGVGYDRWEASQLIRDVVDAGLECQGIAQTTSELDSPSRELEKRLGLRRLHHGGNPILTWMAGNVNAFTDSAGKVKPDKKRSPEKIDGISALVDALWCELHPDKFEGEDFAMVVNWKEGS